MCIRITLLFEDKYDEENINKIVRDYGHQLKEVKNPMILSQLPKNGNWFESANTSCECDTGIGSYELFTRDIEPNLKQIEDKNLVENLRNEEAHRKSMYKKNVEDWELFIKDLIRKYDFKQIGLLVHFTDCDLSKADFSIIDKLVVKYSDITSEVLMKMKNDIIYYFVDEN